MSALPPARVRFEDRLAQAGLPRLRRSATRTLQVNVGLRCDLACHHCHVEAGPKRTEALDEPLAQRVLEVLAQNPQLETLDLTGGAPEMNPHFRTLVTGARALGRRVIDRCNLTILFHPEQAGTAEFLAGNQVDVIASLPCYTKDNVEAQRGRHVFDRSIEGLLRLNRLGYANGSGGPRLDLVYNPLGASLPGPQAELERDYRRELGELFGIRFDRLLTLTNMPIKRFARDLARQDAAEAYQALLVNHFNPSTVPELMCLSTLSVGYDGKLYDCDFNQALELELLGPKSLHELADLTAIDDLPIQTGPHCFGCTAGAGSSCGGALT